ncbi:UDP-glucose/GDP-mannose dehydrogenase family protein [Nocardiopsis sp. EMB25]|uniref:UDP-glucose dehydrogenase family protein n=1 Tax=Nocardiopsis sp. EMB25 TaxID=2835867 RepID=UPI002284B2D7|nr:UDP-glucose/GDP-mannose dehydrogenase family protein [Nocardiopsis sp. EMB25]MCY9783167.1 UDP-glucose/GDP-mannose dehydrogenase family protein [Nocardiopsis sp. EMB25]
MHISVIGCGYLGATLAACLADLGHQVIGVDTDPDLVAALHQATTPFHEPGLDELLATNHAGGRLRFTTSHAHAAVFADLHFLCVGTPAYPNSDAADLSYLWAATDSLAPHLTRPCTVIGRSTVPVGTASATATRLARLAPAGDDVELGWSPEFLREGHGVSDTLHPDRIVLGTDSPRVEKALRRVWHTQLTADTPFLVTDLTTAELVKVAANAFLATKVSFINAMAQMCECAGGDVFQLAHALSFDARIGGQGLRPGPGYGGGCLPKDVGAFTTTARETGADLVVGLLERVQHVNARRRTEVVDAAGRICDVVGGARIAVWGAAFKAGTDDIRDSPALDIAERLRARGARVTVFDPRALDRARKAYPELGYADSAEDAVIDADLLVHLTDWPEFTRIDPETIAHRPRSPRLLDARGGLDRQRWKHAGWQVHTIGIGEFEV